MNQDLKIEFKSVPYSGQIIGAIVEALDIKDEILTDRTAKRYYAGKTISEDSLKQIYLVLGKRLVDLGIIPVPPLFKQHDVSMAKITAASMARLAKKWDTLCASIQSSSGRIQDYGQAIEGFCRLIVIDFALRIVAWLRLAKQATPVRLTPQWAEENGAGKLLRTLLSQAGISRDQFSAWTEVSHISIDNWFDGKVRPTPEHIEVMAGAFSDLIPNANKDKLKAQFQRQFTLAYLADILAKNIGREAVLELATALYRFAWLIAKDIDEMNRPPIEKAAGLEFEMLRHGADEPYSATLLRNLSLVETDIKWQKDILASITGWDLRFQEIAVKTCSPEASAGLAQDLPEEARKEGFKDGTEEDLNKLREASLLQAKDYRRLASEDLGMLSELYNGDIRDRRLIVKRHPSSPQAHMELGSFLGMVGKHFRNDDMINKGISECRIAAALCKDWDTPLVEPAIILINVGLYGEALAELESAAKKLPAVTPHLAMNRGYVLMQTKRYGQALTDFEFVIGLKPNYASALDYAAHCAFMIDDQVRGLKYAKEARKYGEQRAYNDWQKGEYKDKRRNAQN